MIPHRVVTNPDHLVVAEVHPLLSFATGNRWQSTASFNPRNDNVLHGPQAWTCHQTVGLYRGFKTQEIKMKHLLGCLHFILRSELDTFFPKTKNLVRTFFRVGLRTTEFILRTMILTKFAQLCCQTQGKTWCTLDMYIGEDNVRDIYLSFNLYMDLLNTISIISIRDYYI